jgi:hypothetical protein
METVAQWPTNGHSDRPAKFNRFDVFANQAAILRHHLPKPVPHRFAARLGAKEEHRNAFE